MLPRSPLFAHLADDEHRALLDAATRRTIAAGDTLVVEGEEARELFVVEEGRLGVFKETHGAAHLIHEIGPDEAVGEIPLFDGDARSATARALEETKVLVLPYEAVRRSPTLVKRLGATLAARLRVSSEDELHAAHHRAVMGELVVKVVTLLCAYTFLLAALDRFDLGARSSSVVSLPLIGLFGWGSWRFIRNTGRPLSAFGLGLRTLPLSVVESALFTAPFCAALVGLKWVVIRLYPPWRSAPLFERADWEARLTEPLVVKLLAVYLASCLVQELIVRSALQASLEEFLVGPRARGVTVLVCAAMFSVNHLHMSLEFAAAAFLPGVFWGVLFARRRNLAGPVLSHFAVGAFVFFVLGVSMP